MRFCIPEVFTGPEIEVVNTEQVSLGRDYHQRDVLLATNINKWIHNYLPKFETPCLKTIPV